MELTVSPHILDQFIEVSDCLAFLIGQEPVTIDELLTEWCARQEDDPTMAMVLNARRVARGNAAPPAPKIETPAPKRAKDRAAAGPMGEHICPDCSQVCVSALGLSIHRSKAHGQKAATKTATRTCPDCGEGFTSPQHLGAHRRRAHPNETGTRRRGEPTTEPTPEPEPAAVLPIPGFDGTHRLAHERRVGHDVDAYCACGDSSGPTDREDARAWLHQHIDAAAA